MKVELDLSTEQLNELDKGLANLIETLSDEQKTEIVKSYLNDKMDKGFYREVSGWSHNSYTELTEFGKKVIDGLKEKVSENITNDLLQNKVLVEKMEDVSNYVEEHISEIVVKSLVTYISTNLFYNRFDVNNQIQETTNRLLNERGINR